MRLTVEHVWKYFLCFSEELQRNSQDVCCAGSPPHHDLLASPWGWIAPSQGLAGPGYAAAASGGCRSLRLCPHGRVGAVTELVTQWPFLLCVWLSHGILAWNDAAQSPGWRWRCPCACPNLRPEQKLVFKVTWSVAFCESTRKHLQTLPQRVCLLWVLLGSAVPQHLLGSCFTVDVFISSRLPSGPRIVLSRLLGYLFSLKFCCSSSTFIFILFIWVSSLSFH